MSAASVLSRTKQAVLSALRRAASVPRVHAAVAGAARFWFRQRWVAAGKPALWRLCQRTVNAAGLPASAPTWFGATMTGDPSDMVQGRIFHFGVWEPDISVFVARRLAPGDTFVDVGANVGYFSLLAADRVGPSGRVVAIEPMPATHRALAANCAAWPAIRTVEAAVAAVPGRLRLYAGPAGNAGMASATPAVDGLASVEVRAAPLAVLVGAETLAAARLIKIDVEGAEAAILDSLLAAADTLHRELEILVELTPGGDGDLSGLLDRFRRAGFSAWLMPNSYELSENYFGFDPARARRPRPLAAPPAERFDALLSRRSDV